MIQSRGWRGFARAGIAFAALITGACSEPAPPRSILLISLDTLRPDHLGAYGYERATSPRLDTLASQGVLFENAVSPAPWTLPSHASLFTGLYPSHHGMTEISASLSPSVRTLAREL
jgi:arylsulfatase A-like enzyme